MDASRGCPGAPALKWRNFQASMVNAQVHADIVQPSELVETADAGNKWLDQLGFTLG